tara:strand:- start:7467 stop:8432 length:966 start_codon:yes stop_codon:yes gene_type:complete
MSSFLDNSGDIILDAVLTDVGRKMLARADGSFRIVSFCFGDDEINYSLYDSSKSSANRDLNILKTPILEAIPDSSAAIKQRLITLKGLNNQLYLPVARINATAMVGMPYATSTNNGGTSNQFVVLSNQTAVEKYTVNRDTSDPNQKTVPDGFINGTAWREAMGTLVAVDQGQDTTAISWNASLPADLNEDLYLLEIDDRLGKVVSPAGTELVPSFIDTNNIATYVLSATDFYTSSPNISQGDSVISGPRGQRLKFSLFASADIANSDYLYDQIGTDIASYFPTQVSSGNRTAKTIDAIIRVRGDKTGISVNIPFRFVRAAS